MLKIMGKKIFTIFPEKFCISKPVKHSIENGIDPDQLASDEAS